ncbi:hypothetical protein BCR42DRAFT_496168 [Absidia repens]|uniref:Uncharacterized protein n=1 Tax=Absidia repens TaxID=90262 RepID=A0A1X2I0X5_9FUNG|nr:hypothetical protein BCR42DRAFT_496168 [Absidia repens]
MYFTAFRDPFFFHHCSRTLVIESTTKYPLYKLVKMPNWIYLHYRIGKYKVNAQYEAYKSMGNLYGKEVLADKPLIVTITLWLFGIDVGTQGLNSDDCEHFVAPIHYAQYIASYLESSPDKSDDRMSVGARIVKITTATMMEELACEVVQDEFVVIITSSAFDWKSSFSIVMDQLAMVLVISIAY